MTTKYLFPTFIALTVALAGFTPALASPPWHSSIDSYQEDKVQVSMRTLSEKQYSLCSLDTYACTEATEAQQSVLPNDLQGKRFFWNSTHTYAALSLPNNQWGVVTPTNPTPSFVVEVPDVAVHRALLDENGAHMILMTTDNLYVYEKGIATPKQIIPFERHRANFLSLSKNGTYLAYYRAASLPAFVDDPVEGEEEPVVAEEEESIEKGQVREFGVVNLATGEQIMKEDKTVFWDLLSEQERLFDFTPDEKQLLFIDDEGGYPVLYALDLDASFTEKAFVTEQLITRKYSVSDFLLGDNSTVYMVANRTAPHDWDLYAYNFKDYTLKKVTTDVTYLEAMRRVDNQLVFGKGTGGNTQLYAYDLGDKKLHALQTAPVGESINTNVIDVAPKSIELPSGGSALLYAPDTKQGNQKLVVWLHGGPYRQAADGYHSYPSYSTFDWMLEELRDQGIAVLKVDYQGSYGYGREVAENIVGNVGITDVADVEAALKAAKKQLSINEVYLMGNSYGGYLSLKSLVENPDNYKGAISLSGVTEWASLIAGFPDSIFRIHFGGAPWQEVSQSAYSRAAIVDNLSDLTDQKILLFHGDEDASVSYSQSTFFKSFAENVAGKTVELVTWEGVGHIPTGKDIILGTCNKISSFVGGSGNCTW